MKKALIFIEDGSFTYDNRVIREAETLVNVGWDITVICPKYPDDRFYRRIGPNLRVYFYPKIQRAYKITRFNIKSKKYITF